MEAYIQSTSCISPHNTTAADFFFEDSSKIPASPLLSVLAPAYKDYIPANTIRRSSHILKMGVSAGLMCLRNSDQEKADAIVVGTAIGCFEDTDKFLRNMDENEERMLAPTSFIQSTHNTVAGQLALLTKCHGYNFTYVHQNLAFEFALLDALLLFEEKEAESVLVGGLDELNPALNELFERAGHIKSLENLSTPIWESHSSGYLAGEGAAFFKLSPYKNSGSLAKLSGVKTIHAVENPEKLLAHCDEFLAGMHLKREHISLLLSGINGNADTDKTLHAFAAQTQIQTAYFKHLCGEYFTASAFALWLATTCLQKQKVPTCLMAGTQKPENPEHILIVNQYKDLHYGFICVSRC